MLKISHALVYPFSIDLKEAPLVVSKQGIRHTFTHRNGAHLVLKGGMPLVVGVGELVEPVFTLPGKNSEEIVAASVSELQLVRNALLGEEIDTTNFVPSLNRLMKKLGSCAVGSLFAVEQALLRLIANAINQSLFSVIQTWMEWPKNIIGNHCVHLNRLYARDSRVDTARENGAVHNSDVCIKLKIGGDPKVAAEQVNSIALGHVLRLDANQEWTLDGALEFIQLLNQHTISSIEYFEEPVSDLIGDYSVLLKSPVLFAIDESLLCAGIEDFIARESLVQIVYKPFLHGLRRNILKYVNRMTFTCTFETGIGLNFILSMAAALGGMRPHGIHAWASMSDLHTEAFRSMFTTTETVVPVTTINNYEKYIQDSFSK